MDPNKLILLAVYSAAVLALELWPFDFVTCKTCENGAAWDVKKGGIEFTSPGLLRTAMPPITLHNKFIASDGFTIQSWLTSAHENQSGPARIISYSIDPFHRNFMLGQEGSDLVFRLRTSGANLNGAEPETILPNVFKPGQRQNIIVTCNFSECRIFIDAKLQLTAPLPTDVTSWDPSYHLLFGNELTGNRPWLGRIEDLQIYDRSMSANQVAEQFEATDTRPESSAAAPVFDLARAIKIANDTFPDAHSLINLQRPPLFVNNTALEFLTLKPRNTMDIATNMALFFGFGILLMLAIKSTPGSSILISMTICFIVIIAFALFTEGLQTFVTSRTSSLLDFASCIVGGLLGSASVILTKLQADMPVV